VSGGTRKNNCFEKKMTRNRRRTKPTHVNASSRTPDIVSVEEQRRASALLKRLVNRPAEEVALLLKLLVNSGSKGKEEAGMGDAP
jgi:hypothetical protein